MIHPQPISDTVALECSCGWREVHGDHVEGDREKAERIAQQHAALPPYEVKAWPEMTDFTDLLKRG
jgi:hypothetical protein